MGVIVKQKVRGKGKPWWVFVNINGRVRTKRIGDRRAAEAIASKLRERIKLGDLKLEQQSHRRMPRFGEYADHYMNQYAKVACKWSTWRGYETIIRKHLRPVWENRALDQITRTDVKTLILEKQQAGLAASTVENIKALVSGIFTHAYEDGLLAFNPALKLGKYIQKIDRRKAVSPLTREQVAVFLATAQRLYPYHYPLFLTAFRTGMRLGELLGLAWDDIDFVAKSIRVQRAYSHGRFTSPKSRRFRIVDMSDQLASTLLNHRAGAFKRLDAASGGRAAKNGDRPLDRLQLVFPSETGGPLDGDNFRTRVFYSLLEQADLPRFRFHDIRHTFASLLLTQGESLHYVKEQLGHASIQTTVDVYGHLVPGSNRNAVNRLDDSHSMSVLPAG